jgi:hypothetical protein
MRALPISAPSIARRIASWIVPLVPAALAGACASAPDEKPSPAEWVAQNSTVLEQLRSYNEIERRQGISRLKSLGPEEGPAMVFFILSDPKLEDPRVEVILARLLADWKDPRAIPFLLQCLRLPDDSSVRIASEGLLAFGSRRDIAGTLTDMLAGESTRERLTAARTLAAIGTREAIDLLGSRIKLDLDPEVRAQLVIAVISSRNPRRKEFLIDALTDADPAIRALAWQAVKRYPDLPDVGYSATADEAERAKSVGALRVWLKKGAAGL